MASETIEPGSKLTLTVALKKFFGYRPGEGLKEFNEREIKMLTEKDKEDFKEMFKQIGVEIIPAK